MSPREAGARYLQAAAAAAAGSAVSQDTVNEQTMPPRNSSLINDRYMLLDLVEGSTLFKCIDVKTNTEHVCKVSIGPDRDRDDHLIDNN